MHLSITFVLYQVLLAIPVCIFWTDTIDEKDISNNRFVEERNGTEYDV